MGEVFQIKEGDILKVTSTGNVLTILSVKRLANGKITVQFMYPDDKGIMRRSEMYQEVLEMMGLEKVENK